MHEEGLDDNSHSKKSAPRQCGLLANVETIW